MKTNAQLVSASLLLLSTVAGCAPAPTAYTVRGTNIDVSGCPKMIGPHVAGRAGQVGFVEVYLTLNPDGSIQDPRVSVEQPEGLGLGQIALAGLNRCRFVPVVKDGIAVPVTKHLRLTFGFE